MKDINKIINLYCPICGNDQFFKISEDKLNRVFKCSICNNIFVDEEIIESNQELIKNTKNEIISEVKKQIEIELKKVIKQ